MFSFAHSDQKCIDNKKENLKERVGQSKSDESDRETSKDFKEPQKRESQRERDGLRGKWKERERWTRWR